MRSHLLQIVLGILAALVLCGGAFATWELLASEPTPTIVPDARNTLERIVVHWEPGAHATVEPTYRDLFAALPEARVVVAVAEPAHFEAFLDAFARDDRGRFEPVVVGRAITTWSRDRYTLVRAGDERLLYVPPQSPAHLTTRANDWLVPFELAKCIPGTSVQILDFDFDGGDIIAGPTHAFADANLIRKNPQKFRTPGAVLQALQPRLNHPLVVLGVKPEDVPHHHIGMYLTPLPNGAVAVGSPSLAVELLGGESGAEFKALAQRLADEGLPAPDLTPETAARFDGPARQLEALGFRVVRLPLLPLEDQVTFITYNNGVVRNDPDAPPAFLMPTYGVPKLDQAAADLFAQEGLRAHPISVWGVFRHHGSVRCLVNVI